MIVEIIQLGGNIPVNERKKVFVIDEKAESINLLVCTDDETDNMLFSFDDRENKIHCYDSDGDPIVDEKPKKLEFRELIEHFGSSDYFNTDIVVNSRQVIVSRTSEWIDDTVMSHILKGCVDRTFSIRGNQEGIFKIVIQI